MKHTPIRPIVIRSITPLPKFEERLHAIRATGASLAEACQVYNHENEQRFAGTLNSFIEMVRDMASNEAWLGWRAFVEARNWKLQENGSWKKDGKILDTDEGRSKDPAAWLALRQCHNHQKLLVALEGANRDTISVAWIAYETGADYLEWLAHSTPAKRGPKNTSHKKQTDRFRALSKAWPKYKNQEDNPELRAGLRIWNYVSDKSLHPGSDSQKYKVFSNWETSCK